MLTFKERTAEFWRWYQEVAERFYNTIEQNACGELVEEVSDAVHRWTPGLAWVFGPGKDGGHSFTLSGEGVKPLQLLTDYWRRQAPEIPHWTFYSSRQPTPPELLKDFAINIQDEEQVDTEGFLLKTSVVEETEVLDVVAWHPTLEIVPEEHHLQLLFLLLDEALGEFGVQTWLGDIKVEPFTPEESTKRLLELPEFIQQIEQYYQWRKIPPLESCSLYELPRTLNARRGDTVVGATTIPNVVFDFLENDGKLPENPYEELGAEFAYVALDGALFPKGKQREVRGEFEDAIGEALEAEQSGQVLGGAFGTSESYIDLLLLDGERSRRLVTEKLEKLQLLGRFRIESFL